MQSAYDLTVLNAMLEVQEFFEDMITEAYDVSEFDDVPGDIKELDIIRFAELSDETIRDIIQRSLSKEPFKKSSMTIDGVVNATITKLHDAKGQVARDKWPASLAGSHGSSQSSSSSASSDPNAKAVKMVPPADETTVEPEAEATDANHKKLLTARYDLKTMNRMQQINNRFNDALVALYGVEDEDELPEPVIGFVFGEVITNNKWDIATIRVELEKVIKANPWKDMDEGKLAEMIDSTMNDLKPYADKMLAAVLEQEVK